METYFDKALKALNNFLYEIRELKHKPLLSEAAL